MNPMQRNLPLGLCFASWGPITHNNNIPANTGVYDNKRERQSYKKSLHCHSIEPKMPRKQLPINLNVLMKLDVVADVQCCCSPLGGRSKKHLLKKCIKIMMCRIAWQCLSCFYRRFGKKSVKLATFMIETRFWVNTALFYPAQNFNSLENFRIIKLVKSATMLVQISIQNKAEVSTNWVLHK